MPSYDGWKMMGIWKICLLTLYQNLAHMFQFLPGYLSLWFVAVLRILFFSVITFSAWIKAFPVGDFPIAFSQVVLALSAGYVCYVHTKQQVICWPEREKQLRKMFDEEKSKTNKMIAEDFEDQKRVTKTLNAVTRTLVDADKRQEQMQKNEIELQDEVFTLKEMIKYLRNYNMNLERKIEKRRDEILELNKKFQSKIGDMEGLVAEMHDAEKKKKQIENQLRKESSAKEDLDKTNVLLQTSVDVMNKQRRTMIDRQGEMTKKIRELQGQNDELRRRLQSYSNHDFGEINKITQKLQTSLSTAKGKLAKVRGVLQEGGHSVL